MPIIGQCREAARTLIYGDTLIPQELTIAMPLPQQEVSVFLHGMGSPINVTDRHTTASCAPLLFGVSLDREQAALKQGRQKFSLEFRERNGDECALGAIQLAPRQTIAMDRADLILFSVLGSMNHCIPRLRRWAHYVPQAYHNWRRFQSFDVKMTSREVRASQVAFIRPHPLMLGSIGSPAQGNIFPMNLMGHLGHDQIAFALKNSRRPAHLVEHAGRIAVSSLPLSLSPMAFRFAVHHTKEQVGWETVPFALRTSAKFGIPVPSAAGRVMELEVSGVYKIGSHTLFIAQIVADERVSHEPQLHIIHGFYQHWRLKGDREQIRTSVLEDRRNKKGQADL